MIFSLFKPSPAAPAAPAVTPTPQPPAAPPAAPPPPRDSSLTSPRALKQLGLFFAGAAFFALTATVTRRSVARKQAAAQLKFYAPSGSHTIHATAAREGVAAETIEAAAAASTKEQPQGALMAVEAFGLATLNTVSFFMMLTGGVSWGLDISTLDDLRAYARRYTRPDGATPGMTDEEAERELEIWMASVLAKKDELFGGGKASKGKDEPAEKKK